MNTKTSNNEDRGTIVRLFGSMFAKSSQVARVNSVFIVFLLFGFYIVFYSSASKHAGPALLWSLACLAVGSVVGLLFGIPRMRQKNAQLKPNESESEQKYQPEINNNLIEVSDWLTKIIVGVGLIELSSLPEKLRRIARPLEVCINPDCGLAIAVGIIVYFTAAGFLAGYINARTFIAVLFRRSDDELLEERVTRLQSKVEAQQVADGMRTMAQSTGLTTIESPPVAGRPVDRGLAQMASDYERINDNSYRVRVAKKDQAATEILRYVLNAKISKFQLFEWAEKSPSNGLILAAASYVLSAPAADDLMKLLLIADKATWLHTKFRVALAFRALCLAGFGSKEEWQTALVILENYREAAQKRDDSSLATLADEVIEIVRSKLN